MTSTKFYTYITGTVSVIIGLSLCLIFLFPSKAIEMEITDGAVRALSVLFILWFAFFALSLHTYVGELRSGRK